MTRRFLLLAALLAAAVARAGDVIEFHTRGGGFRPGVRWAVTAVGRGSLGVRDPSGRAAVLPLGLAEKFEVYTAGAVPLAVGDVVRVTRNATAQNGKRLVNGALARVTAVTADGIALDTGAVLAADFGYLAHGYVVTSHASQGKTVDRVLLAQSSLSFTASGREQLYVSASRGREAVTVYTDDTAGLRRAIERSDPHRSATDLVRPVVPPPAVWRAWVKRRLDWLAERFGIKASERDPSRERSSDRAR